MKGPQGSGKTRLVRLLRMAQEPGGSLFILDAGNESETLIKPGDFVLTIAKLEQVK